MDTASKLNNTTHFLSFSRKLFLSVISLFLVFAGCFLAYQYQREKEYKIDLLDIQLQDYNERLHQELAHIPDSLWNTTLERYLQKYIKQDLRITVVDVQGDVLYDSFENQKLGNHINRPEVQKALAEGKGYDVRRTSETTGVPYFYSATLYEGYIIRSALPYDLNLVRHLAADQHYIWFTLIVSLLLIFIFYKFTSKLGTAINQLREFAKRADKNEPVETDMHSAFPHNELGEISQHIIQIYKRLRETKEALYIEREKLITHLQTSHEGLGVFNKDKKEILVNNLFTQYSNLISDSNLQTTEEIFSISEFQKITDFINKTPKRPGKEEKRMSISINKNGRMFIVECIIFQDLSFEISINDVTQEEEQIRLKRQLTQNIAHELKTPVSSIQGYLETIVNNEDADIPGAMLCSKQSAKPTATRHLRINAYGRSRQHDRHGESRHQPVGRQYRKRGIPGTGRKAYHRSQLPKTEDTTTGKLFPTILHFPQPDGQCHCLCRHGYTHQHQLFPRGREFLLFQFCRYRRRRLSRTSEPLIRTLLSGG